MWKVQFSFIVECCSLQNSFRLSYFAIILCKALRQVMVIILMQKSSKYSLTSLTVLSATMQPPIKILAKKKGGLFKMQLAFHFLSFCLLHSIKERPSSFCKELLRLILACQSGVTSGQQPQEATVFTLKTNGKISVCLQLREWREAALCFSSQASKGLPLSASLIVLALINTSFICIKM